MTNKRGAILGILLPFIVVPKCAHAMNSDELDPDRLKKKILNSYTILNGARSKESIAAIAFLKEHPTKEPKLAWLRELLSSITEYRKLTRENGRFSYLEKVIKQEMQERARYTAKKDSSSEDLDNLFKEEWEKEKNENG